MWKVIILFKMKELIINFERKKQAPKTIVKAKLVIELQTSFGNRLIIGSSGAVVNDELWSVTIGEFVLLVGPIGNEGLVVQWLDTGGKCLRIYVGMVIFGFGSEFGFFGSGFG